MKNKNQRKQEKKQREKEEREKMWEMFRKIWDDRPHYSELSWTKLGKEILSVYFHHILPKSKYKEAMFDEENIILLTWDEHTNVENNPTRYEEINKRRKKLMEKYG